MDRHKRPLAGLAFLLVAVSAAPARAQDAFEIQVYDYETADPGMVGIETHINHFAVGVREADPPELPTHQATHLTFEPHIGIASWCEAGAYIQTAIRGDGHFDFAGLKLRFKARYPRRLAGVVGLALNTELSSVPVEYEATRFGIELRPVIDFRWKRLYASINPMIEFELAGPYAGVPHIEPVAKISIDVLPWMAIGPEYYGSLGPVTDFAPLSQQVHRIFGTLDFSKDFDRVQLAVNLGAGYGLAAGEKWIVKAIVGLDFDRGPRPQLASPPQQQPQQQAPAPPTTRRNVRVADPLALNL